MESKKLWCFLVITFLLLTLSEARGGRRGGSFGGLFGSFRKYKKHSSSGSSSRRIVSSSPVHTPITKAFNDKKKPPINDKFNNKYYNKQNVPPIPPNGAYYSNAASLPGNAIYINQSPPRGSEMGNFLMGYLSGRLLTMGMYPTHHVTHVYRNEPDIGQPQQPRNTSVVIVNTQTLNATADTAAENESNSTVLARMTRSTTEAVTNSSPTDSTILQSATKMTSTEPVSTLNGIICVPILVQEPSDQNDKELKNVEKIVCYPAPTPSAQDQFIKSKPVEIAGDIAVHRD